MKSASVSAHLRFRTSRADLAAMPEEMVGENDGEHGLAHRHGADANARIVAADRRDVGILAGRRHGLPRRQDRRSRLHREAYHDLLAGRDAAQYAARMIGAELGLAVAHAHL